MSEIKHIIPQGWRTTQIGNCVVEKRKSIYNVEDSSDYGQYPFFTSGEDVRRFDSFLVDGENLYLADGGMADVKYYKGAASYSNHTYVLGCKSDIDTRFFYYLLLSLRDYIDKNYFQGTGLKNLNKKEFKKHEIIIPSEIEEQHRIANTLLRVEEALSKTENLISKHELLKRGLITDLLSFGLDKNGVIRSETTHQFKDSAIGRIPEEWDVVKFADLAGGIKDYIKTGPFGSSLKGEHWRDTGIPVITIGSLGDDSFIEENLLYIDQDKANELAVYALKEGDILFSRVADVGRSLIIDENHAGWIMSSNFMRLRIDTSLMNPLIINYIIKYSSNFKKQISKNVNNSGRSVTNTEILNSFIIPQIPNDEQKRILDVIDKSTNVIKSLNAELSKSRLTGHGLLNDLITGKVRV